MVIVWSCGRKDLDEEPLCVQQRPRVQFRAIGTLHSQASGTVGMPCHDGQNLQRSAPKELTMLKARTAQMETEPRMSVIPAMKRNFIPLIIIVIGVILATIAFAFFLADAEHQATDKFDDAADTAGLAITSAIASHVEAVRSIQDLYLASTFVTRDEFKLFTIRSTGLNPGIQALEWIPRVTRADRAHSEALAQDDGFPNFTITQRNSEGQLVSADERDEYFPVYYLEPLEGNEAALGFDLGSNPTRLAALEKARDTGKIVVSGRITLIQETGSQFGILVFGPVYAPGTIPSNKEDRRNSLQGFVLGVFRIGDVITTALVGQDIREEFRDDAHEINIDYLDIALFDISAPAESQLLYSSIVSTGGEIEDLPPNIRGGTPISDRLGLYELSDLENRTEHFFFEYGSRSYALRVSSTDAIYSVNYRDPVLAALAVLLISIITALAVSTTTSRFRARDTFASELSRLIDTTGVPIFELDDELVVTVWNSLMERITGIPARAAVGKTGLADFIIPTEVEIARDSVIRVLATGETAPDFEIGVKSTSGQISRVVFNCTPRLDSAGKPIGVFVVGQDITERTRAAAELQKISDDLTRIIETANAPIFGVDVDGNVNEWNANVSEITGYSRDEILGKSFVSMLISAEYQSSVNEVLELALSGEQTANYESPIRTRDGRTVQILLNASTRRDDAGNIVGVIGIGQDITERTRAATERNRLLVDKADLVRRLLESQEEERGSIAYDLHDGPAQHLSGASMFLESYVEIKDEIDSAERDSMISTAKGYVGSALEEIQRIMAGLRPSALDDLGLVQGLRESVREVARRTGRKIEFFTEMDENIEVAAAAEIVLYRISQEAVSNAVKHSATGTISVELSDSNGALILKVTDRGAGFDVDAVMNSPEKRGMGLLGMHERADLIGADLSVDSEIGEGTTVTITLPDFGKLEAKSD